MFASSGMSQVSKLSDIERIGKSDVIVTGTIDKVIDIGKVSERLTLRGITTLKGTKPDDLAIVNLAAFRRNNDLHILDIGKRYLFFLFREQDGYMLFHGALGMLPESDENQIISIIKDFPLTVLITKSIEPFNFENPFDAIKISASLTNNSKQPITITDIGLEGFFAEKEFPVSNIDPLYSEQCIDARNTFHNDIIVKPGQPNRSELKYPLELPDSWIRNPPTKRKTYNLYVRICVTVKNDNPDNDIPHEYNVCSPYCKVKAEYIPVDD